MQITALQAASCKKLLGLTTNAQVFDADTLHRRTAWRAIGWCDRHLSPEGDQYFDLYTDDGAEQMRIASAFCITLHEVGEEF